jgi:hypothetical protein
MVHQPTMAAMDFVLWPIVRFLGKPAAVVIVAAVVIAVVLVARAL